MRESGHQAAHARNRSVKMKWISFCELRERDHKGWSTVLVTALGSWGKPVPHGHSLVIREGDPKGWSAVLVTALGSWGKPVPHSPFWPTWAVGALFRGARRIHMDHVCENLVNAT